jgi:2-polyprenyl-6-methoxyphenol hydroxylase-like FAD-dependent oxidoreductase
MQRRALVAGAGIGGLAVGRVLREAGFEVSIFERAPNLTPQGAGISLWPNATRVLRDLGVTDELPSSRSFSDSGLHRWNGRLILSTDFAEIERRYGAPMLFLQRTTLHGALLDGGMRELVRTDAEVIRFRESGGKVQTELRNGETVEADLLIGADGIRSKVRAELLKDGAPRSIGLLAYRALTELPPFEFDIGEFWGPGRAFGVVPVDGGRLFWLSTRRISGEQPAEVNPIPGLLERHRDWTAAIPKIIETTEPAEVMRHEMFDRKPTKRWVSDRVALLGDAAHPMHPFLGQGACQALEDVAAIDNALRAYADIPTALHAYQEQRRKRAAFITKKSRGAGLIAHVRAAPLRAARDRTMTLTTERMKTRQYDSIVGKPQP